MPMPAAESNNNMVEPAGDVDVGESLVHIVQKQGQQLLQQEQRIKELEAKMGIQVDEEEDKTMFAPNNQNRVRESQVKVDSATYQFEASMWDAALLVYVNYTNFTDMAILMIGCCMNLALQISLLLTVYLAMLENDYDGEKVKEMLLWRLETGHQQANFDSGTGESLIAKLCSRTLWSFEQEQYKLLYDYLYKPMPGVVLSTLAIVMWVLTIMVEYRRCVEQAMAVYHLPPVSRGSELVTTEDDTMQIVGLHPAKKGLVYAFLSLPRLGVMMFLGVIGCQYLAQTVSLADIVLNAVALAFVMDVDELVADVMLTERLRQVLHKVEPMTCGKMRRRDSKWVPLKDLIRYVITLGLIILSIVLWLIPFHNNIEAASLALCGGYQDFSYSGGTSSAKSLILEPKEYNGDAFLADCSGANIDPYYSKYYGAKYNSSLDANATIINYALERQVKVLNFAFHPNDRSPTETTECAKGEVLFPQNEIEPTRICKQVPLDLAANLPNAVKPDVQSPVRDHAGYPQCTRFTTSTACAAIAEQDVCIWNWQSRVCESDQNPPGATHDNACSTDLNTVCDTWDYVLGVQHPTYNCVTRSYCESPYTCLAWAFTLQISYSSMNAWATRDITFDYSITNAVEDLIKETVVNLLNNGLDFQGDYTVTRVQNSAIQLAEATIDLDQGHVTYDFGVGSLPYQVKPHVYVNRSAFRDHFNDYAPARGAPTARSVDFTGHYFLTTQDLTQHFQTLAAPVVIPAR